MNVKSLDLVFMRIRVIWKAGQLKRIAEIGLKEFTMSWMKKKPGLCHLFVCHSELKSYLGHRKQCRSVMRKAVAL